MAVTTPPSIDPAPDVPVRGDRATFSSRVDAFLTWLAEAVPKFSAAATNVYNNAVDCYNNAQAALDYKNDASGYANAASDAAGAATSAANSAVSAYDAFDDRFLGSKASDPTLDNDGNPLLEGVLYWKNTAPKGMRVYDGSAWQAAYLPEGSYLTSASIGSSVQAYDADTAKKDEANSWTLQQTFKETKDTVYTITDGAAFEIDPANGNIQVVTLGANRTPKATNFEAGQCVLLGIDDGTAYSVTWSDATVNPTWLKVGGTGAAPTLATTGYTWILLFKQGTTLFGCPVGSP